MAIKNISELQDFLDIQFNNMSLLVTALTHSSYASENLEVHSDNERLEFLGDAVLDAVVSSLLFNKYQDIEEGDLTILRSKIVNGNTLAESAKRFGLGEYLLLGRGEDKNEGRAKTSILSSALEALLGAIFIDKGFDTTCDVISNILRDDIDKATKGSLKDPKTKLQEIVQSRFGQLPEYNVISQVGEGEYTYFISKVTIDGEESAVGQGASKLISEMKAAEKALVKIKDSII